MSVNASKRKETLRYKWMNELFLIYVSKYLEYFILSETYVVRYSTVNMKGALSTTQLDVFEIRWTRNIKSETGAHITELLWSWRTPLHHYILHTSCNFEKIPPLSLLILSSLFPLQSHILYSLHLTLTRMDMSYWSSISVLFIHDVLIYPEGFSTILGSRSYRFPLLNILLYFSHVLWSYLLEQYIH